MYRYTIHLTPPSALPARFRRVRGGNQLVSYSFLSARMAASRPSTRAGRRASYFIYTGQGRLPQAVTVQTPQGATSYILGYDQVGSLKAVAAMDGENEGRVVKVVVYDAFGNILADSNPGLFMPLSFAGGLRDRFTGLVCFRRRDCDPIVGRFTAPDPLGDTGGDHDLYDYRQITETMLGAFTKRIGH